MDYKIIVLDLDGTLTNREKKITPRTRAALMEAQEAGKIVVLASGRPTAGVEPLARELELARLGSYILSFNGGVITNCRTGERVFSSLLPLEANQKIIGLAKEYGVDILTGSYILSFNGGVITNCRTGERVFSSLLPLEANQKIIGLAKEYGVDILTYEGDHLVTNREECPYAQTESRINHLPLCQVEMEQYVTFQVPKFLMLDDGDYLAVVEPRVKAALGRDFSVYRSEPFFLEIMPKGIDKAQSLERLLMKLGLKREEMIACGDGYNDLSMIKYAGLGVAMENAVLPVRTAADHITASNNEDGVGLVVEKFMLGRQ